MKDEQIDRLADAVAAKLNGQLSGIRKDMEAGFTEINGRLGKVEGRLGKVEGRLGKVENHLDRMDAEQRDTSKQVEGIVERLDARGF